MRFSTRIAAVASTVALAGGGMLATAGTAQAAKSDCPKTYLCSWATTNFSGLPGKVAYDNSNLRQYYKFANSRSMYNNGASCSVRVWAGTNYTGSSVVFKIGYQLHDTSNSVLRNGAGSNRWC
ncbi:peptidase inhibitor family I36 protein [Streptomyces fenghuangensis]|uniref:Peptidase inhibitor family I36 protein n=1 Tax=Streptomyces chitinivorans TaxID=1257027 RepID=A0ABW7HMT4_9ACTN|nr:MULTISPECIES: peptidase inhibitor family I36 protein [Streptomyces]MCG3039739.1 peptidase inhibitor family I36 protein [Streptomyces sp. ICN903]MDH2408400.1 peptidase inhibitor family I36 protein [Streptomyces chitinivorans]